MAKPIDAEGAFLRANKSITLADEALDAALGLATHGQTRTLSFSGIDIYRAKSFGRREFVGTFDLVYADKSNQYGKNQSLVLRRTKPGSADMSVQSVHLSRMSRGDEAQQTTAESYSHPDITPLAIMPPTIFRRGTTTVMELGTGFGDSVDTPKRLEATRAWMDTRLRENVVLHNIMAKGIFIQYALAILNAGVGAKQVTVDSLDKLERNLEK